MTKLDQETLGESLVYLPSNVSSFIPDPVRGSNDSFSPPPAFLRVVRDVAWELVPVPSQPLVWFECSSEAASENAQILEEHDFDLRHLIQVEAHLTLGYGSEFQPLDQL